MKTMHQLKISFFVIFIVFLTFACSKDRLNDNNAHKSNEYTSLDDFYTQYQPQEQEFVIDSIGGDTIVAQEGTKIYDIPKEIFMKKSDHTDISYPYSIKLLEAYSMKNKILSKRPGLAQGNVLYSDGNIRFRAFKNSDELELKEHCGLSFQAPSASPASAMHLFYGFTSGSADDWNANVLATDYLFTNDDVTMIQTNAYGYKAKTAKMGWINIAKPLNGNATASMTFEADGSNTQFIDIFIIFNNLKSYVKVNGMQATNLPLGEPVTVFAIAKTSQHIYYYKENFTTVSTIHVILDMQPTTESQILDIMNTL